MAVVASLVSLGVDQASAQSVHWDGGDSSKWDNGVVDGGAGTWRADINSFTDANGTANTPQDPSPGNIVFGATGGIVTVDNSAGNALVDGMHFTVTGYDLRGDAIGLVGNEVEIRVGNGNAADDDIYTTIRTELTGDSDLVKTGGGNLWLAGTNSYAGNTRVEDGLLVGDANSIRGNLTNNAQVLFRNTTDQVFAGNIDGSGVMGKMGGAELELTGTSTLDWDIVEGGLVTAASRFGGDAHIDAGAWLLFYQNSNATWAGRLTGAGEFDVESGHVRLTGNSGTFTGSTWVGDATLEVNGTLGGTLEIDFDANLMGTGTVGDTMVAGTLTGLQGQTLALGSLMLQAGANVDVALGAAGSVALFDVTGDLTLDGTLNVSDAGGFGAGIYRLFTYGGTLTNNGLAIGDAPMGVDASTLAVQTSVANQVNLLSAGVPDNDPTGAFHFWDGGDSLNWANGQVDGGDGTWCVGEHSFTLVDGSENRDMQPAPGFAVFQGNAGTVTVDNSAGDAQVTGMQFAADGYVVRGDSIRLTGGQSTIRVGDGTAAGSTWVATVHSDLTGDAGLVVSDLGTLVLSGENTYTGGTTVQSGRLVGDARSIRGNLLNNGEVIFDQDADWAFAGDISGAGGMRKIGTGELSLTGNSALDWAIDEGGIVAAAGRFGGDANIGTGAWLAFYQNGNATYAGTLSGSGEFDVEGGHVRLTGNSSGFTGSTWVGDATLEVDGTLGGTLEIDFDARLMGSGTVGSTMVLGTLAPGNGIGTLNVNGDLVFGSGAVFEVDVDAAGNGDRVAVTGTATLGGGSVLALASGGNYALSTDYTILSANGSVSGTFGSVSSSLAFLTPSLAYGANVVTLTLERNALAFPDVAVTENQAGVATAVESLGMGSGIYDAVVTLDEADARFAFDRLSGEIHASAKRALLDDTRFLREAVGQQVRNAAIGTPLQGLQQGERTAWARGYGAWAGYDGDGNASDLDRSTLGLVAGADLALGDGWRIGLAGGHARGTATARERASSLDYTGYQLALYGGWQAGAWGARFGAAQGWNDVESARSVVFNGYGESSRTEYEARTTQVFAELGYGLKFKDAVLEPFVNVARVRLAVDAFGESGGDAALQATARTDRETVVVAGVRGEMDFVTGNAAITANASLAWRKGVGDDRPEALLAFDGGESFVQRGAGGTDAAVVGIGVEGSVGRNATLGLSYDGVLGSRVTDNGLRLHYGVKF